MKNTLVTLLILALCHSLGAIDQKPEQPLDLSQERANGTIFTQPGIIGYRNGQWVGTDHLFNLTNQIGVSVEVVTPPNVTLTISKDEIIEETMKILSQGGLAPHRITGGASSPLPFFHFLIMVFPLQNGYLGSVSGRLFEAVDVDRIKLAQGIIWQAITWEKQTLIISSKEEFALQLKKYVDEITQAFVDRYKHFEGMGGQNK